MLSWLAFHRKRRSLERSIENITRLHIEALKKLGSPTHEDKERLYFEFRSEQQLYEDELALLISSYLTSVARRMFLPVPEFKENGGEWEEAPSTGRYHLTSAALSTLRSAIRREQKEKHELWLLWLAALTGFVGAITGLVAVLGA